MALAANSGFSSRLIAAAWWALSLPAASRSVALSARSSSKFVLLRQEACMRTVAIAVICLMGLTAYPQYAIGNGLASAQAVNPASAREAFIDVDGSRLHYEECGTGPDAVVLLHAGVVNCAVWHDC